MNAWSIYTVATGVFTGRSYIGPSLETLGAIAEGEAAWPGEVDASRWRLDTSGPEPVLADYRPPPPPSTDTVVWRWCETEWRWKPEPTPAAHATAARLERTARLQACDWVVTKAQETGQPVPAPWREYRQALRDVSLQAGWPLQIDWPLQPE